MRMSAGGRTVMPANKAKFCRYRLKVRSRTCDVLMGRKVESIEAILLQGKCGHSTTELKLEKSRPSLGNAGRTRRSSLRRAGLSSCRLAQSFHHQLQIKSFPANSLIVIQQSDGNGCNRAGKRGGEELSKVDPEQRSHAEARLRVHHQHVVCNERGRLEYVGQNNRH